MRRWLTEFAVDHWLAELNNDVVDLHVGSVLEVEVTETAVVELVFVGNLSDLAELRSLPETLLQQHFLDEVRTHLQVVVHEDVDFRFGVNRKTKLVRVSLPRSFDLREQQLT